jgi:cytochrome c
LATLPFLATVSSPLLCAELDPAKLPPPASGQVEFDRDIRPVFESTCFRCHGPERPKSHFRLDNRDSALKGGDNGIDIVPGDSAKSPLAYYITRVVPDLEMPPPGKGQPLTREQVGLFRAWIDQGASWGASNSPVQFSFSAAPTLRWISVEGSTSKFREIEGMREGLGSGLEQFSLQEQLGPDKKFSAEGRALFPDNDFQIKLALEKTDLGFVRAGFEQWRRYYDDTGGYYRPFAVPAFALNRDLHLDLGRAWFDLGLTLPRWPKIVLGYEYQFNQGAKSTLEWGDVDGKTIFPAAKNINEHTHIVKLDVIHDFSDWHLEDKARVEIYNLQTSTADVKNLLTLPPPQGFIQTREAATHVQGMNTIHLERQIADWWLVSAGYLYSRLKGDASLNQTTVDATGVPIAGLFWSSDLIQLDRESHVLSVASLMVPAKDVSLSLGLQPEWTHQSSLGDLHFDEGDPDLPQFFFLQPAKVQSDLDTRKLAEEVGARYTGLPWTVLFGEARWDEQHIGQTEDLLGDELLLSGHAFYRDTDFSNVRRQYRAGFNTSPWRAISLNFEYRRSTSDSDYENHKIALEDQGYSAFINGRKIDTEAWQSKLALRPAKWLKLTLTHQWVATDYQTATAPVAGGFAPGGAIFAGEYSAHVYGVSATLTPFQRFYAYGSFTYSDSRTATAHNGDPSLVPYEGNIYSLSASVNYALNLVTDLHAAYSYSRAAYGQNNFVAGLPLGLDYTRHSLMAGVTRRINRHLTSNLRYAFYQYSEPSSGALTDYTAHGVFATFIVKWP